MVKVVNNIDDAQLVVVTIPIDIGSKRRYGQKLGARRLRELVLKSKVNVNVFDYDELFVDNFDLSKNHKLIESEAKKLLSEGKSVLFLGGDHSISYGICKANKSSMIYSFDAHPDLVKEDLISCQSWLSHFKNRSKLIGVRWMTEQEKEDMSQLKIVDSNDCHVSLDVDVFDPKLIPGVAYPTKKGLGFDDFKKELNTIFSNHFVSSFDINEYCPLVESKVSEKTLRFVIDFILDKLKKQAEY